MVLELKYLRNDDVSWQPTFKVFTLAFENMNSANRFLRAMLFLHPNSSHRPASQQWTEERNPNVCLMSPSLIEAWTCVKKILRGKTLLTRAVLSYVKERVSKYWLEPSYTLHSHWTSQSYQNWIMVRVVVHVCIPATDDTGRAVSFRSLWALYQDPTLKKKNQWYNY